LAAIPSKIPLMQTVQPRSQPDGTSALRQPPLCPTSPVSIKCLKWPPFPRPAVSATTLPLLFFSLSPVPPLSLRQTATQLFSLFDPFTDSRTNRPHDTPGFPFSILVHPVMSYGPGIDDFPSREASFPTPRWPVAAVFLWLAWAELRPCASQDAKRSVTSWS
jgi:hypothetical protein